MSINQISTIRQTQKEHGVEANLIIRYGMLLKLDKPNLYAASKSEWIKEIKEKINELNSIISQNNFKTTKSNQPTNER